MATEPMRKQGRHYRRALRRLSTRQAVFEGPGNDAKKNREQLERGAFTMPGSMKGNA